MALSGKFLRLRQAWKKYYDGCSTSFACMDDPPDLPEQSQWANRIFTGGYIKALQPALKEYRQSWAVSFEILDTKKKTAEGEMRYVDLASTANLDRAGQVVGKMLLFELLFLRVKKVVIIYRTNVLLSSDPADEAGKAQEQLKANVSAIGICCR
jgi:hypothetical protein